MRARSILWAVAAGAGLVGVTVAQATRLGAPEVSPASPAAAAAAAAGGVAAEGRVVTYPGAEVRVAAERPGRLVRVLVDEGQAASRGQLLAELESEELRAALAEARARLAETEAEERLAGRTLERRRGLAVEGVLAGHDLDQAVRDLDIARARRATAVATVARYEAQLRKTRIVAPIAGTVTARHLDAGETVEAGEAVVTLADLRRLRIDAEADEADAAALTVGASTEITSEAYPGRTFRGRVEEIGDAVTPRRLKPQDPARPTDTRILAVKVAFLEGLPLKLGTTVELRIAPAR